jgi:hypothetical protein
MWSVCASLSPTQWLRANWLVSGETRKARPSDAVPGPLRSVAHGMDACEALQMQDHMYILNSWFEGMWLQPKHMRVTVRDGIVLGMKRRGGRKGLRVDGAQYGEYKLRTLSEERQSQVEKMKAR